MREDMHRDLLRDLALVFATELEVAETPFPASKAKGTQLDMTYQIDGMRFRRGFRSPTYWRALLLTTLITGKTFQICKVHGVKETNWHNQSVMGRLEWFARQDANFAPAVRLYDPNGPTELFITRSRLQGHAVDVLHNLSDRGPLFQPLLVLDILALEPMVGIKLSIDESFQPSAPISTYLRASAKASGIDDYSASSTDAGNDLSSLFAAPTAGRAKRAMWRQACLEHGLGEVILGSTIAVDYRLGLIQL